MLSTPHGSPSHLPEAILHHRVGRGALLADRCELSCVYIRALAQQNPTAYYTDSTQIHCRRPPRTLYKSWSKIKPVSIKHIRSDCYFDRFLSPVTDPLPCTLRRSVSPHIIDFLLVLAAPLLNPDQFYWTVRRRRDWGQCRMCYGVYSSHLPKLSFPYYQRFCNIHRLRLVYRSFLPLFMPQFCSDPLVCTQGTTANSRQKLRASYLRCAPCYLYNDITGLIIGKPNKVYNGTRCRSASSGLWQMV